MSQGGSLKTSGGGGTGILTINNEPPVANNFNLIEAASGAINIASSVGQVTFGVKVDGTTIVVNGSDELSVIPGAGEIDITPDIGVDITNSAFAFNGFGGLLTNGSSSTVLQITDKRFTTQYIVDPSSTFGSQGEYTTLTAANAAADAAGGGQIFIRSGTYAESFVLGASVSLNSYASLPGVFGGPFGAIIDGTITFSNAGQGSINGISMTNSTGGPCLTSTGSNGFLILINNCNFIGGTGAILQGSNGNGNVLFGACDFIAPTGDFLNCTGAKYNFKNCNFLGLGGSGNFIYSGGNGQFEACDIGGPISLSSGASVSIAYSSAQSITTADTSSFECDYCTLNNNATILTTVGTGFNKLFQCILENSGGAAINIGAGTGVLFDQGQINSQDGAFAVTGTGSFEYGLIEMLGAVQTIDPALSTNAQNVLPYATTSTRGLAFFDPTQFAVSAAGEVSLIPSGSIATNYTNVTFAMNPYNVLSSDYYLSVDSSGGGVIISFPSSPTSKQTWVVKDRTGNSSTFPILINAGGGSNTFDGSASYVIDDMYESIQILANPGGNYELF